MISRHAFRECLKLSGKGKEALPVRGDGHFFIVSIYGDPVSVYPFYLHILASSLKAFRIFTSVYFSLSVEALLLIDELFKLLIEHIRLFHMNEVSAGGQLYVIKLWVEPFHLQTIVWVNAAVLGTEYHRLRVDGSL